MPLFFFPYQLHGIGRVNAHERQTIGNDLSHTINKKKPRSGDLIIFSDNLVLIVKTMEGRCQFENILGYAMRFQFSCGR